MVNRLIALVRFCTGVTSGRKPPKN